MMGAFEGLLRAAGGLAALHRRIVLLFASAARETIVVPVPAAAAASVALMILFGSGAWWYRTARRRSSCTAKGGGGGHGEEDMRGRGGAAAAVETDLSVLPCIRNRRSVFPKDFMRDGDRTIDDSIVRSLLDAALWGPFHGRCFAGCGHPARFVVLGKDAMIEMQHLTLRYYDDNWKTATGYASEDEYLEWRRMTRDEIAGRWGPVSFMIAIVMRRQSGPRRLPEWEESAAVAAATQNMHLQSTKFPELACYWSSWHDAARDSDEMKEFLGMGREDRCLGFFIVARAKRSRVKDRRRRDRSLMEVEWRA
mmetsp:Transcript_57103/g.170190  ORF Transcript_57103/g.170190 Transcript_57103/m.170190 type:complete len:309 (-) Transcript_57103:46-972(-)